LTSRKQCRKSFDLEEGKGPASSSATKKNILQGRKKKRHIKKMGPEKKGLFLETKDIELRPTKASKGRQRQKRPEKDFMPKHTTPHREGSSKEKKPWCCRFWNGAEDILDLGVERRTPEGNFLECRGVLSEARTRGKRGRSTGYTCC